MLKKKFYTIGQVEAEISDAMTRFEKEYLGRGPLETRTRIVDDMVIVRFRGPLTKAEMKLLKTENKIKSIELLKSMRVELIESCRSILETTIKNITKRKIRSIHTDMSTTSGEKMIVFVLEKPIDLLYNPV